MSDLLIKVRTRTERGKANKKIRKNKFIPAVVYGNGQKNLSFSLDIRDAEKYSKKGFENKIFTFESEDKNLKGLKVIKKVTSRHKVSHQPIHMDFLSLDMTKTIRVPVDLKFIGTPKGVKEEGGIFNIILRSIELECLPSEIPPYIELDVSGLSLNQNIHVADLKISGNIKIITKSQRTLCTVVPVVEEEVKTEATEDSVPTQVANEDKTKTEKKD
ncbi:MAG: 50S ribosomal protein L25 [Bdellovibrionaceae bacterium]|nr:50S ribosomal protein L25 [Pseudobdellovibrionaceae bacterium]